MSRFLTIAFLFCMVLMTRYDFADGRLLMPEQTTAQRTVSDVLAQIGLESEARLKPYFEQAGAAYPPDAITMLAIKDSQHLELWAREGDRAIYIRDYEIQAASGISGPKLREGDFQVPEGLYRISWLNPNSAYHLSMKLNYPNAFDRLHAEAEGRDQPGSDIFIHGRAVSIGCLAMGDPAIEELFTLVSAVGVTNVDIVIAPRDPRLHALNPDQPGFSDWVTELYSDISKAFEPFLHE